MKRLPLTLALTLMVTLLLSGLPVAQAAESGWSEDLGSPMTSTPLLVDGGLIMVSHNGTFKTDLDGKRLWRLEVNGTFGAVQAGDLAIIPADGAGLVAISIDDGSVAWTWDCAGAACSSAPTVVGGKVYVGTSGHNGTNPVLAILDALDGTVLSTTVLPAEVYYGGVAVLGAKVFVPLTRDAPVPYATDVGVIAFADGVELWRFETRGSVVARPLVSGDQLVVATKADGLVGIDIAAGYMAWKLDMFTSTSDPVVSDGRWFIGTGFFGTAFGEVMVVQPGTVPTTIRMTSLPGPVQARPVPDGDGGVYVSTNAAAGMVYHLDAEGRIRGSVMPDPPDYILGAPVVSGSDLYVTSDSGYLHSIPLSLLEPGAGSTAGDQNTSFVGSATLIGLIGSGVLLLALLRRRA